MKPSGKSQVTVTNIVINIQTIHLKLKGFQGRRKKEQKKELQPSFRKNKPESYESRVRNIRKFLHLAVFRRPKKIEM